MSTSSSSCSPRPAPSISWVDGIATLIPGLPNDIGALILSRLAYSHIPRLRPTCKAWRQFLSSQSLRRRRKSLSSLVCVFPQDPTVSSPFLLDLDSPAAWLPLPPAPCHPNLYALCNFSALQSPSDRLLLLLLGGSHFDARSFPLDRPSPSAAALRLDLASGRWARLSPMLSPRGSFACAAAGDSVVVAGGGARHNAFAAAGRGTRAVERYSVRSDRWEKVGDGMPEMRAGCVGFVVDREFWVMGGYGEPRTVSGVFPVDRHCRSVVAMDLESGEWREIGEMWGEEEEPRLGKIAVVLDEYRKGVPGVYMLHGLDILRYDIASNRWHEESRVPREAPIHSVFGFMVSDHELVVITNHKKPIEPVTDIMWRPRQQFKKTEKLYIQMYNPRNKTWRSLIMNSPFNTSVDFNTAVLCNVFL